MREQRISYGAAGLGRDQLAEAVPGLKLQLADEDLVALERAAPRGAVHGERYGAAQMADLDSER